MCAIGADFVSVVTSHEGWDWVDEGSRGVHKWGFVSEKVRGSCCAGLVG